MIIQINGNQEVIFSAEGVAEIGVIVDDVTTFLVANKPEKEVGKILCFNPDTREFYHTERPPVDEEMVAVRLAKIAERRLVEQKRSIALKWLAENDWKVNKRMLGEWGEDDPRWIAYLAERAKVRADYDEAVSVLNGMV